MMRAASYSVLCLLLMQGAAISQAHSCPPLPSPARWTQASADGALELVVVPEEREPAAGEDWQPLRATYRLERTGADRKTVWEVRSQELQTVGFVASDGDYVVTANSWLGVGSAVTIRNSAGAVIRSISESEIVSIAERLDGAYWKVAGLDAIEEFLEIEILRFNGTEEEREPTALRRIQLMDGSVIDPPATPVDFELPQLDCPTRANLAVEASLGELSQTCIDRDEQIGLGRRYELEEGAFRLVYAWNHDLARGEGREWTAPTEGSDACEAIYREGGPTTERCGPDVTFSP